MIEDLQKICAVSGASGYLGTRVCAVLRNRGWSVCELRRAHGTAADASENVMPYDLNTDIDFMRLKSMKALVHCAYDLKLTSWSEIERVNVQGSIRLLEAAHRAGVPRIIFISTMSAYESCASLYGKAKLMIENYALSIGAIVIRPGLIYGPASGGMMGALKKVASLSKVLPMVSGGRQVLYLCHEDDLCSMIVKFCEDQNVPPRTPVIAASAFPMNLRMILLALAGHRIWFLPVPWPLVWLGLKSLELLQIRIGFKSDSLIGLVRTDPAPDFLLTEKLGFTFRDFDFAAK